MRIYLHLTANTEQVPFNYQAMLVGALHKWLGPNELHDDISLYSLSWLKGSKAGKGGLDFPKGASLSISSADDNFLLSVYNGIAKDQLIRWGMRVKEITLRATPDFGHEQRFLVDSPVLVKRKASTDKHDQYYYPNHPEADGYLTETLQRKLEKAGLPTDVTVAFDKSYAPKIKMIQYRDLSIKASFCPVIVSGNPRAVAFAWEVGVGNSTGIGFGALR